jgi:hypothetical protein
LSLLVIVKLENLEYRWFFKNKGRGFLRRK